MPTARFTRTWRNSARPFSAEERDDLRRIYAPYVSEELLAGALRSY